MQCLHEKEDGVITNVEKRAITKKKTQGHITIKALISYLVHYLMPDKKYARAGAAVDMFIAAIYLKRTMRPHSCKA